MAFQVKHGEPDVVADIAYPVYYRGLDKELHRFDVKADNDAVEARRLVKVQLDSSGIKTIGPVLAIITGGK